MASGDQISGSESSDAATMRTPEPEPEPELDETENSPPRSTLSHRIRESPKKTTPPQDADSVSVLVPAPARPWEYQPFRGDTTVDTVQGELEGPDGFMWYKIEFEDGKKADVPLGKLTELPNGQNALNFYNGNIAMDDSQSTIEAGMPAFASKRVRTKIANNNFVDSSTIPLEDSEAESEDQSIVKKRRLGKGRISLLTNNGTRQSSRVSSRLNSRPPSRTTQGEESSESDSDGSNEAKDHHPPYKSSRAGTSGRSTRSKNAKPILKFANRSFQADDEDEDELAGSRKGDSDGSDIVYMQPKRPNNNKGHQGRSQSKGRRGRPRKNASSSSSPERAEPSRRSGRDKVSKNMRAQDMDEEMYADDVAVNNTPKVISIRELFHPTSKQSPFGLFHNKSCDVCSGVGSNSNKGTSPLIHCQGCSSSIHKVCLGYRSGREHLVTKVGYENFVLQCRRCIGIATKKDRLAPRLGHCQDCKEPGRACAAFAPKRTAKQEEKLREDNEGDDPITEVSDALLNKPDDILFRCTTCQLAYHFEHLPTTKSKSSKSDVSKDVREERLKEYSSGWQCPDCRDALAKVQSLVAWRPADRASYVEGQTVDEFREDEREYLIKWTDMSYFKCTWMPGGWVWGVTAAVMRKAFLRRDEGANELPKWTDVEAVPEEYLRMEIVFDVRYDDTFRSKSEAVDKAAINTIEEVFVKFQGLSYDEAVWEEPPKPEDASRWSDFVAAYNEYVAGRYLKQPPAATMKERANTFRSLNFEKKVERKKQPSALTGGQMMPYQMEGLNWLLYNFHQKKNVILADEMGLGKTIQIIAFIASLVQDNPKCWPFLVVTPNSTCPNWRREIKKWAPDLRVVAYYGVKKARDMAMEYELYPDGCSDMRAHVVITSYEAPVDDHSRSFFKRIKWAGMIVDEGQRLKNDENLLYVALKALKAPFQVLLTGTPLQNNKRELFNLLQFLDTSINAAKLDEEYEDLTKENLPKLHDLIRPFFLRRTKLQVLKFLPPMAQVILPVTMSVVQKKLYRSILAKNPELIRSIMGQTNTVLRPTERGNLNNILMQLRKCLCHPFLYSTAVEEISKNDSEEDVHRKLVEASSKFQLLKIMLPKLRERGHRVLLFSQFLKQLDMVEDFLTGLDLPFQRLDGTIGSLEKQKRIDAFNASDSEIFAFLLSTRAGGVGINLATADTVIIMDPDFNPHQDIQALSRAHRIGQKKKVLVFQLMTKDSAEEKIVQIGRKKMALDQALIESMDTQDDAGVDLESILRHGAQALFSDDDRNDIRYDSASVDKLLDRTQVENTSTDEEKTAESQFSFARVWANDKGTLTEDIGEDDDDEQSPLDLSVWDKILKEREEEAAAEAARNMQTFGRGQRARNTVDYHKSNVDADDDMAGSPLKQLTGKKPIESASDQDFASAGESDGDEDFDGGPIDPMELATQQYQSNGLQKGTKKSVSPKKVVAPKVTPKKGTPKKVTPKKVVPLAKKGVFAGAKKVAAPFKNIVMQRKMPQPRKRQIAAGPKSQKLSTASMVPSSSTKQPKATKAESSARSPVASASVKGSQKSGHAAAATAGTLKGVVPKTTHKST